MKKLESISIFFPFYNDGKTVAKSIRDAFFYGKQVAKSVEVIAIHGGNSHDDTWQQILTQKKRFPRLKIIDKKDNHIGYAVIKYGFAAATKKWTFYTDGDLQYDLKDLIALVNKQYFTNADVVNGYKLERRDNFLRVIIGNIYRTISKSLYRLPISDLTCDFRLIKTSLVKNIHLKSRNASILLELIIKLKMKNAVFAEVPLKHFKNRFRPSNYNVAQLALERIYGDFQLRNLYNKK